jgi:hypothetical protein
VNALGTAHPSETKERIFEGLLNSSKRRLMAIARAYAPGEEARDLYQEILLQLWRGLDGFAWRSQLDTWVYRVALNSACAGAGQAHAPPLPVEAGIAFVRRYPHLLAFQSRCRAIHEATSMK